MWCRASPTTGLGNVAFFWVLWDSSNIKHLTAHCGYSWAYLWLYRQNERPDCYIKACLCADHTLDWTGRNKVLSTQTRSHRRTQANKWHVEYLHFYQVIRFYQVERTCSITNDHFITIKFGWLNLQHHKASVMVHNLEVDNIGQVGNLSLICKVQNKSNPTCIEFHFRLGCLL